MHLRAPAALTVAAAQRMLDERTWSHPGTAVRREQGGLCVIAVRAFAAGETIYSADVLTLPDAEHEFGAHVLVDGKAERIELGPQHTVRFDGTRWIDVPGCLLNHACEPTTASVFSQPDGPDGALRYDQIALVALQPGDELTCDYTRFDWGDDGLAFACACASPDCHGWIDGFGGLPRSVQERTADTATMESARRWALSGLED